jgi:hypothetical protein
MHRCASNFLDTIFDSAPVVGAARVVLIGAAAVLLLVGFYVAASVLVRIRRREWLRKAGPFEVALEEVSDEMVEATLLTELYTNEVRRNQNLTKKLAERDQRLARCGAGGS